MVSALPLQAALCLVAYLRLDYAWEENQKTNYEEAPGASEVTHAESIVFH